MAPTIAVRLQDTAVEPAVIAPNWSAPPLRQTATSYLVEPLVVETTFGSRNDPEEITVRKSPPILAKSALIASAEYPEYEKWTAGL